MWWLAQRLALGRHGEPGAPPPPYAPDASDDPGDEEHHISWAEDPFAFTIVLCITVSLVLMAGMMSGLVRSRAGACEFPTRRMGRMV